MKRLTVATVFFILLKATIGFAAVDDSLPPDLLTVTPNEGHSLFNDSIDSAQQQIDMVMFHLSDPDTVSHLLQARERGVTIRIILDGKVLASSSAQAIRDSLSAKGVEVRASSTAFSITHEKAAIFDGKKAIVSSINLTKTVAVTRDFGVLTADTAVIAEMESVFAADWQNAENNGAVTPDLSDVKLVWSPVNSKDKIIALIQGAQHGVLLETENLGDSDVIAALSAKASQGVPVTVVVPACVEGMAPTRNLPYLQALASGGVSALASAPPYTADHPYIHAKVIVVDGTNFYVGSENLSHNSLASAREVGIIEANSQISQSIAAVLQQDAIEARAIKDFDAGFSCRSKETIGSE